MPTLSDEEFIAQSHAKLVELEAATKTPEAPPTPAEPVAAAPPPTEPTPPSPSAEGEEPAPTPGEAAPTDEPPAAGQGGEEGGAVEPVASDAQPPAEPDYKAIYQRLFGSPIRAAGQDITLTNPDEAISLIQKGVGFHTKMNRLHNDLRYVEMLRNNNLLDEGKLSLLIDAQAGKPGAIKKLLDSVQVDPLTLDSAEASTYAPSDHRVTDEQLTFQSTVSDLSDSDAGKAILRDASGWDQNTKAEIYKTPGILEVLAQQKELGRYDLIVAEVQRGKVLGTIPATEPFIQAYTRVGQQMMQAGRFGTPPAPSTPTPVAQKVVTPPALANKEKAAAAAPTRATAPGAKPPVDISQMDDAAFEAHFRKTLKI